MTELLVKLWETLLLWWGFITPFHVLGDDEVGLVRRVGKFHRFLEPGFNLKIPILESVKYETSALDSTVLHEQSLTSKDGKSVSLKGVLTYRIVDARKYILGVATTVSVMNDVGCVVLANLVPEYDAKEVLQSEEFQKEFLRRVKLRAKRWGVEVDSVGLIDRVEASVLRLLTSCGEQKPGDVPGFQ